MRVLITGISGFIGRAVAARLAGYPNLKIIGTVRDDTTRVPAGVQRVLADFSDSGWIAELPGAVDVVIHLAQSKRYREFPSGSRDMVAVNIDATAALLEWAAKVGVQRFIFTSTGNVYRSSSAPLDEDASCDPGSMYAASKLCAELLVRQYARLVEPCILRVFGVYGPGQTGMLIPNMIGRIIAGEEISLAQGIGLSLTPLHIRDCVEMVVRVIRAERCEATTFNLCGNEIVSLGVIVKQLGLLLKREPRVRLSNDVPQCLLGDNARFIKQFGYSPLVGLEEGLKQVVEEHLHANN